MAKYTLEYTLTYSATEEYKQLFFFNTPVNPGDEGPEVEILKLYLGIDNIPGETHGTFDTELQSRLRQWQSEYYEDILAEREEEEIPEGEATFIIPINQFDEQGRLGDLTLKTMWTRGFLAAAKQYLESDHWREISGIAGLGGEFEAGQFPTGNDENQRPPTINGPFIEYKYVTNYTKQDFEQSSMVQSNSEVLRTILRKAVLEIFDFYNKPKTWVISGAPRPDLPESLSGLYSNADHLRTEYEKILKAVRRIEEDEDFRPNQQFVFTVEEQTLQQQLDNSTVEVDVLFGQDMNVGASANFAAIGEVSEPGLRPSATYNVIVRVRRDLFEAIEGGQFDFTGRTGGTFDVTNIDNYRRVGQAYGEAKEKAQELWNRAGNVGSILTDPSLQKRQVEKFGRAQRRKLEKSARNFAKNKWDQARTGQGGGGLLFNSEQARREREEAAIKESLTERSNPGYLSIKINQLRDVLSTVANKMEEFHEEVQTFKDENSKPRQNSSRFEKTRNPMIPDINPRDEARKLREVIPTLEEFFSINGYQLAAGPSDNSTVDIVFSEVRDVTFGRASQEDLSLSTDLDEVSVNPTDLALPNQIIGYRIESISITNNEEEEDYLTAGTSIFTVERGRRPFIYPTTMAYLSQIDLIEQDIRTNPCDELSYENPSLVFFSKWHFPQPSYNYNKKANSGINIDTSLTLQYEVDGETKAVTVNNDADLRKASILTATEEFAEQRKLLSENIKALKQSTLFEKRGRVIQTGDKYPEFGKIPCDIEKMWEDFLNQWDMNAVMCDLKKCIPELEPFNAKFDWKLPVLPDIPTFDPIHFVLPQLKISLNDIILSFICKLIKSILDTVRRPDCTDLIRFGLASFSALQKLGEDDPFANAQQKATTFEKAADTINQMGIPGPALDRDAENVLEAVSLALTPSELCDLLQGDANEDVLNIVLRTIQSLTSNLKEYLKTIDEVEKFFTTLGTVVDPFICDRIRELNDIVIAQELCRDDEDLRQLLQNAGASEAQIRNELDALDQKRKILNDLSKNGDFSGLLPGLSPQELAAAGLPGPHNNSFQDKMVKLAVGSILTNVKSYFDIEISAFARTLIEDTTILVQPGDEGFNSWDYARFLHYRYELRRIEEPELPGPDRPQKPYGFASSRFPANDDSYYDVEISNAGDSLTPQSILTDILGVEPELAPLVPIYPEGFGEDLQPEEFADNVERYVIGYIQKYGKIKYTVFDKLRQILLNDTNTIVRKNPSLKDGYRELNIRFLTSDIGKQPFDVTGLSKESIANSIGLTELPFSDRNVKDCYRFAYDNPFTDETIAKTYFKEVPEAYANMRRADLDIVSSVDRAKLLRPGGFASFMIQKYKDLADGVPGRNNFGVYSDGEGLIYPKLQGYLEPMSVEELQSPLNELLESAEGSSEGIGGLILGLIAGAIVAAEGQNKLRPSLYESAADSFIYQLSNYTSNSDYFEYENLLDLEESSAAEYRVSTSGLEPCYIKNKKIFDFDRIVEGFVKKFREVSSRPQHDPSQRDFNEKGPFEESMIEGLFKLYIDFYSLDLMLKGIFMLSETGTKDLFKSEMIIDYVTDGIINELDGSLTGVDTKEQFNDIIKSITNQENPKEAIRSMVVKNLNFDDVASYVEELFEPKYSSFKERFYNELVENIKDVPSMKDYPVIVAQNRGYSMGGSLASTKIIKLNIAPRYANLYDKFKFNGYSDEMIEKKINSGHFWVEKFYRIKDFNTFRELYGNQANVDELIVNSRQIDYIGGGAFPRVDNNFEEYISELDLGILLFGQKYFHGKVSDYQDGSQYEQGVIFSNLGRHIVDNLQVGYRLMFGHKVFRKVETHKVSELKLIAATATTLAERLEKEARVLENDPRVTLPRIRQQALEARQAANEARARADSAVLSAAAAEIETVSPEQIYTDFIVNSGVGDIGLRNNPGVFSRKKSFVNYVDSEPIYGFGADEYQGGQNFRPSMVSLDENLNLNSVLYQSMANLQDYDFRDGEYSFDAEDNNNGALNSALVYSIPIDEYVVDVDCFDDLFGESVSEQFNSLREERQQLSTRLSGILNFEIDIPPTDADLQDIYEKQIEWIDENTNPDDPQVLPPEMQMEYDHIEQFGLRAAARREMDRLRTRISEIDETLEIGEEFRIGNVNTNSSAITQAVNVRINFLSSLFDKYRDIAMRNLLSLEGNEVKTIVKVEDDGEYMKPHRVMFDFLFPLDRYAALHFLQNIEVHDSQFGPLGALQATKLFIIQNMLIYDGLGDTKKDGAVTPGTVDNTRNIFDSSVGAEAPSVADYIVIIAKAIASAIASATAAATRAIAAEVDPGYRDMRKGYKKDPCSMKYGLVTELVGRRFLHKYDGDLKDGFGTRNGCKQYVPVTQYPADFMEATFRSIEEPIDAAIDITRATKHLIGTVLNKEERYGYPIGPIGDLALGVRQNKGERHSKLKKDNACEEGCESKELITPEGLCED